MAQNIHISGIHAIMLGVRNLEQSVAFYQQKLGLQPKTRLPELTLLEAGPVTLGLSTAHARNADNVAGRIEVVFRVENVRAAQRALRDQGISFLSPEPMQATASEWVAHFRDPDGHLLSLFGPEGQA